MKRSCIVLILGALVLPASAETILVEDGRARAVIVTSAQPSEVTTTAAAELQHFLERMSGTKLPIRKLPDAAPGADATRILVGPSEAVRKLEVGVPTGYDFDGDDEGFVLETVGRDLVVAGNEDGPYQGTLYAAYELLERLGCRWYFPGAFGEVVPKTPTVRAARVDVVARPSFAVRNIWRSGWADTTEGYGLWARRNKMTGRALFAFPGDGSIRNLAPPDKHFKEHPEIYALSREGERVAKGSFGVHGQQHETMLCMTNPLTVRIAVQTISDYFKANPQAGSYAFSPPDGAPRCHCEACLAGEHDFHNERGSRPCVSDTYYNFVNKVARAVAKDFPDRYILTLAYSNRVRPPEGLDEPWSKNIIIQIARLGVCTMHPLGSPRCVFARQYLATLDAWSRFCSKLAIYDYDPQSDLSRMPFWNVHSIRANMPIYHQHGVIGFTTEGHNTFLRTGLNYYIRARLMWDVNADVDALLEDFYRNFFGPAAAEMQAFIEAVEDSMAQSDAHMRWTTGVVDWAAVFPQPRIAALSRRLGAAERLADTPEIKSRVAAYRAVHQYMMTYHDFVAAERGGRFAEAVKIVDRLAEPINAVERIQKGLYPPDGAYVRQRRDGMDRLRNRVTPRAERDGGPRGERVALAPEHAGFRTDPHNLGLFEQWHRSEVADRLDWKPVSLHADWTTNGYRDAEGHGYTGYAWYRFSVPVPERFAGRTFKLHLPAVHAERMWIWANGRLVHSPTHNQKRSGLDADVSRAVQPGKANAFTVRIYASQSSLQHGGLAARPLLWSPRD